MAHEADHDTLTEVLLVGNETIEAAYNLGTLTLSVDINAPYAPKNEAAERERARLLALWSTPENELARRSLDALGIGVASAAAGVNYARLARYQDLDTLDQQQRAALTNAEYMQYMGCAVGNIDDCFAHRRAERTPEAQRALETALTMFIDDTINAARTFEAFSIAHAANVPAAEADAEIMPVNRAERRASAACARAGTVFKGLRYTGNQRRKG